MNEKGPKTRLLEYRAQERVPYLLFQLKDSVYGVHVRSVHEIVMLPELKQTTEGNRYLIGVVNLRGTVVPVMDLELRFGRKSHVSSLTDYLLVLDFEQQLLGLVVNDVLGVERVEAEQLESNSSSSAGTSEDTRCVDRLANIDDKIVALLELKGLFSSPHDRTTDEREPRDDEESRSLISVKSPADEAEFRRRADRLRESTIGQEADSFLPVAVAEISGEFFAFELEFVKEFFETQQITPVPCCPQRILGNVNLRGDVLTIVDIRPRLNLPAIADVAKGKVVVARIDDLIVGVLVDELHGVFYLPVADVTSVPSGAQVGNETSMKGTASFREQLMGILDMPKLLQLENWVVDEKLG